MASRGNPGTLPPNTVGKEEVITEAVTVARHFSALPPVKKSDPAACQKRIDAYFEYCRSSGAIPSVEGLSSAMRLTRQALNLWQHDGSESGELVARAKQDIATCLVQLAVTGAVNPVFPMFLLKTGHHYVEPKQEYSLEISPKQDGMHLLSREQIAAEFGEASETPELPEPAQDSAESEVL